MTAIEIIPPVDPALLKKELDREHFLRETGHGDNELYIVDNQCAPNVIREIGRLREISFRTDGGGSGKALDVDEYDLESAYRFKQLVLWDPEAECIIGGYRFALCDEVLFDGTGQPKITSAHLFHFTRRFLKGAFKHTIELGRAYIRPEYQSTEMGTKSIYALDNLLDGLASLTEIYKGRMEYFFGKVSIYPSFPEKALQMILYFLRKHFGSWETDINNMAGRLVVPKHPLKIKLSSSLKNIFTEDDFNKDYIILKREVKKLGVNIPPLVNTYMNLSPSMKSFGSTVNDEFGDVIESGILIKFDEIRPEKINRHLIGLPQFRKPKEQKDQ